MEYIIAFQLFEQALIMLVNKLYRHESTLFIVKNITLIIENLAENCLKILLLELKETAIYFELYKNIEYEV